VIGVYVLAEEARQLGAVGVVKVRGYHEPRYGKRKADRESSGPATLGSTLAANLALIVWCKRCRHRAEPDVAELVERCGAGLSLPEWATRLRCSACGSREVDFVVSGGRRELCRLLRHLETALSSPKFPNYPAPKWRIS
jgi:hypothetical protein